MDGFLPFRGVGGGGGGGGEGSRSVGLRGSWLDRAVKGVQNCKQFCCLGELFSG